jgi:methylglutaconyl-CoA hydratase
MAHEETLLTHTEDGIHTITLNRPDKRNALNPLLIEQLTDALEAAARSTHCGIVILTGAGSAFCAGLDLDHLQTLHHKSSAEHCTESKRIACLLRKLYDLPKPTIAAVNGAAIAGGMGIATICDFTYAVPEASFGYTEVKIGFVPAIVSAFLRRQVGEKVVRDLLFTGRVIKAPEALTLGLVSKVVDASNLMAETRSLAQTLLQNSPSAIAATKRLLSKQVKSTLDAEIDIAITANAEARGTDDFKEGIQSFLEKRAPRWHRS